MPLKEYSGCQFFTKNGIKIPKPTVFRLSKYRRQLMLFHERGVDVVSSELLARVTRVHPAQLRKDLSYFGRFGVRGVGYDVAKLLGELTEILGLGRKWKVVLVGARLGRMFLNSRHLQRSNYEIVLAFDDDPSEIGTCLEEEIEVHDLARLPSLVPEHDVSIALLALGGARAQRAADLLVECGVKGILALAAGELHVPKDVAVQYLDLSALMDAITFDLVQTGSLRRGGERMIETNPPPAG